VPLTPLVPTALVAAAAALLGWFLFFRERPYWMTVIVVLGATAAGVLLAMLLVRPQPRRRAAAPVSRDVPPMGADGWWSQPTAARAPVPGHGPPPPDRPAVEGPERGGSASDTAQLVLPVDGTAQPGTWWSRGAPTQPTGEARRPSPRDLAEYRDSTRVVQCPRCGAFRIDVTHVDAGYAFRCRVDDHRWTWRPGTAWPVTVVASRRRTDR
jgi:hypothetical protein